MTEEEKPEVTGIAGWFIKAGALSRNVLFVLSVFALLLAISLLFQFTAQRADIQNAQDTLNGIEDLAVQADEQRQDIKETLRTILDCTTEKGDCFKKGQEQTAEVVAGLNIVTQYSVICGERLDGEQEILDCVNTEVKQYMKVQESQQNN